MPIKVLHCADFHLDTVFSFLDETCANIRREELRMAFSKVISLADEKNADMLIISGDLFDSGDVSHQTARFIERKFSEISHIPVYIACGNHDPKTSDSYFRVMDFGKNVHVFERNIEWIETEKCDIYGVSFGSAFAEESFLADFCVKNPDKINIMVMHGDFTSEDYNLITKTQMEKSGIDYLALGHIHKHEIIKAGDCTAVYPGCPEGRGFDETGKKGVVFADVSKGKAEIEFISTSKRTMHEIEIDVSETADYESLSGKISDSIKNEDDLYKIVLTGEADFKIDTDVLKENIKSFFVKIYDKTTAKIDLEKEAEQFTLKGLFIKKALSELSQNEDDETLKEALKIGLSALGGR